MSILKRAALLIAFLSLVAGIPNAASADYYEPSWDRYRSSGKCFYCGAWSDYDYRDYKVRAGDTVWNISERCGIPYWELYQLNPHVFRHRSINYLKIGEILSVPYGCRLRRVSYDRGRCYCGVQSDVICYTIKRGDTLFDIANKYHTSVESIQYLNGRTKLSPHNIVSGREICVRDERRIRGGGRHYPH